MSLLFLTACVCAAQQSDQQTGQTGRVKVGEGGSMGRDSTDLGTSTDLGQMMMTWVGLNVLRCRAKPFQA